jgi:hypothetical protein
MAIVAKTTIGGGVSLVVKKPMQVAVRSVRARPRQLVYNKGKTSPTDDGTEAVALEDETVSKKPAAPNKAKTTTTMKKCKQKTLNEIVLLYPDEIILHNGKPRCTTCQIELSTHKSHVMVSYQFCYSSFSLHCYDLDS